MSLTEYQRALILDHWRVEYGKALKRGDTEEADYIYDGVTEDAKAILDEVRRKHTVSLGLRDLRKRGTGGSKSKHTRRRVHSRKLRTDRKSAGKTSKVRTRHK